MSSLQTLGLKADVPAHENPTEEGRPLISSWTRNMPTV